MKTTLAFILTWSYMIGLLGFYPGVYQYISKDWYIFIGMSLWFLYLIILEMRGGDKNEDNNIRTRD